MGSMGGKRRMVEKKKKKSEIKKGKTDIHRTKTIQYERISCRPDKSSSIISTWNIVPRCNIDILQKRHIKL